MLNKYGLSVVVCACFLFAACGGGNVGGDVTEDAGVFITDKTIGF